MYNGCQKNIEYNKQTISDDGLTLKDIKVS